MATVLIIEDSSLTRKMLVKVLEEVDHTVLQADCGAQGVKMIEERHPDCVSLDLSMPGMDGFELFAELKERDIAVPVVVLSEGAFPALPTSCFP